MFNLPAGFLTSFLHSQLFTTIPIPSTPFTGQTIIITGSNTGLGLSAARHFVRLGAAKVILGCRSLSKGESALTDIESTTDRKGVLEVWEVDMSSYKSVKAFCERASQEERIDVVVENAGIAIPTYEEVEGTESTIAVNVIATFLMALLMLPILRRSAAKHKIIPRLVVVASEAHEQAKFKESNAPPGQIFTTLSQNRPDLQPDRYNLSKLLEILVIREIAPLINPPTSTQPPISPSQSTDPQQITSSKPSSPPPPTVVFNCLTPGFCHSELFRNAVFPLNALAYIGKALIARPTEVGSRTLVAAAAAGEESHGKYMVDCEVREPSAWVRSIEGRDAQRRVWEELRDVLESVEEGVTRCLDGIRL